MSELSEVLDAHREAIRGGLFERIAQAGCSALVETASGGAAALFEAFCDCCRSDDAAAAKQWADERSRETGWQEEPDAEVLLGLHCLEQVVRLHAVTAVGRKKSLLAALSQLGETVDLFHRCYLETVAAEPPEGLQSLPDFTTFAAGARDFTCLATVQGKPFYLNRAGRRLIGLGEDEPLPDATLHDYYADESWEELRDVGVPAVNRTGRWEGRSRLRNLQSGELLDVLTSMFRVKDIASGKPTCLAIIHRDAAPWNRLEQDLAESQARKHAILESALDPIITIDHRGVITEFNRAAEQIFGHPREKVLGTEPSEVLFPPSKSAGHHDRIDRYLRAGKGSMLGKRAEVTAVRANGETFSAELAMTISQEHGAPVMTFFVRDISERKKAEQEQARYAAELRRSNEELEQFAYVASHDLQEPLRKIRTFGDRLEIKCGDQLDETGRDCVERMQMAAGRMQGLIDGLLTLSRVTTKQQNFEPVDLTEVAHEVVSDLEVQIEQIGGRVEVGKLPTIQADALQIRQLLQNLIGNGLKFRRTDEPPLIKVDGRFVPDRRRRRSAAPAAEEACRILVEDNGIGVEERHLERIFGVFQRLHPRGVYEGTGIGLAICRRIVQRHGGSITARCAPGHGTTFEVVLPASGPQKTRS